MFFLIPYQHDRMAVRRLPWVSLALLAVNFAAFALTHGAAVRNRELQKEALRPVYDYWAGNPFVKTIPAFEARYPKPVSHLRSVIGSAWEPPPAAILARQQAQFEELMNRPLSIARESPYQRWGYLPSEPSFLQLITSQFMHAGWLHLLGNMLFLYLGAPFIEDRWGRLLFPFFYLTGGVAAALTQGLSFPGSTVPLVGASGAIAAVMGAFVVCLGMTKIRFFWAFMVIGVRWGTFDAPAWLMLPFWLAHQALQANVAGADSGVAFRAHIGGFLFGAAVAAGLRFSGIEGRFIRRVVDSVASGYGDQRIDQGKALQEQGKYPEALEAFAEVLREKPGQPDAHNGIFETALAAKNTEEAAAHAAPMLEGYLRAGNTAMALERYDEIRKHFPDLLLAPRILYSLAGLQEKTTGADFAIETYRRLASDHPNDLFSLKGLIHAAQLAAGAGTPEAARGFIDAARSHSLATGEWQDRIAQAASGGAPPSPRT